MKTRSFLKQLAMASLVLTASLTLHAADITGTWTWTTSGRNGGPDRTTTLSLTADGDRLSGKVSSPGRAGATVDAPIINGKAKGDQVSFDVVREFNGRSNTNSFSGTVSADKITGTTAFSRNGEPQTHDWTASRSK